MCGHSSQNLHAGRALKAPESWSAPPLSAAAAPIRIDAGLPVCMDLVNAWSDVRAMGDADPTGCPGEEDHFEVLAGCTSDSGYWFSGIAQHTHDVFTDTEGALVLAVQRGRRCAPGMPRIETALARAKTTTADRHRQRREISRSRPTRVPPPRAVASPPRAFFGAPRTTPSRRIGWGAARADRGAARAGESRRDHLYFAKAAFWQQLPNCSGGSPSTLKEDSLRGYLTTMHRIIED